MFEEFVRRYLSHLYPLPFADFHKEIIELLENYQEKRIVILVPREHGKTTLLVGFAIYALLSRLYRFILYISQSQEQARRIASTVKIELEVNPDLIKDFGNLQGKEWTSDSIEIKNGCRLLMRGIGAGLRGLNIRGRRPDLIILDDVETDRHHYSAVESERLKRIFKNAVLNLGKDAKVVVVGTMGGKHGLLYELSQSKEYWRVIHYQAIKDGEPLWREKWSLEDLERKRLEIGDVAFTREFMNEIVDTETIFQPVETNATPKTTVYTAGIDFGTGRGADYNAIVVVGWIENNGFVVYSKQAKNPETFINEVVEIYQTYPFRAFVESNNFQFLLTKKLAEKNIPVIPITTTKSKYERFLEIQPKINTGLIQIHYKNFDLLKQLKTYPYTQNDDLLDALYFAITYKNPVPSIVW